jgi:hypothetical protein
VGEVTPVADTLGLLEEARQIARDLGYGVREEPLGDLPGGPCTVAGAAQEPKSRLLAARLEAIAASG